MYFSKCTEGNKKEYLVHEISFDMSVIVAELRDK